MSDTFRTAATRITERITDHRINSELELEALNKWAEMPASERMKKVSLFRKEEDDLKRQLFVKQYIRDHYESRLRSEMEEQGKSQKARHYDAQRQIEAKTRTLDMQGSFCFLETNSLKGGNMTQIET